MSEQELKVEKKFKDSENGWRKVSLEDCLQFTEGSGFFKVGAVKEMLEQGQEVETPFAVYRRKKF